MGCDIHAVFQAERNGRWTDIPSKYEEPRHYFLFAWLAGVRNGFGFAGIPTHDPIVPIAEPRGLPRGVVAAEGAWFGDHSHSWLTADEILGARRPGQTMRTGVIERALFDKWDGVSQPERWYGDISGRDIVIANSPRLITPETTHVRIEWQMPDDELDYFVDEVKRLRDEHGRVRMVFGFDS